MFFTSRNRKLVDNINKLQELEQKVVDLNLENSKYLSIIEEREKALNKIIKEKCIGFPWLADVIAEFYRYQDVEINNYLMTKSRPALKTAEIVREITKEKKILRKKLKIAQNFVNYYETLFPWISDYVGEDLDDLLENVIKSETRINENDYDPVLKYVPRAEYQLLPTHVRNQKALDRYLASRKKPYEIGRDYERYIGYLYEKKGFIVEYTGIEKGLEDLGRDLICKKENEIEIVQCKCWANYKTIHEKHINQLYGTAIKYFIEHHNFKNINENLIFFPDLISSGKIKATFITSTKLSETANKFAKALMIKVEEELPLKKYPVIKCNINSKGERIYHLPFDQQYDRTVISKKGEFYAESVEEAESLGFRRAFRWSGNY